MHQPVTAGMTRGDPPVPDLRSTAYARATLHPLATAAGVLGIGARTTLAVLRTAPRRRRL